MPRSATGRKLALTGRGQPDGVAMTIDGDGPRTLAAAICHLAAAAHSKDHAQQQQVAGLFYENCITDFAGCHIDKAVEAWFADFLKKPLKK